MPHIEYFAHSDGVHTEPAAVGARWQPLRKHLLDVASRARKAAESSRPGDTPFHEAANWAGLLHDLGKYTDAFQAYLRCSAAGKPSERAPHAIYGAAHARRHNAEDVLRVVHGHHTGLQDTLSADQKLAAFKKLAKATPLEELIRRAAADGVAGIDTVIPAFRFRAHAPLEAEFRTRLLFSCLIDADRQDTAQHLLDEKPDSEPLDAAQRLKMLLKKIELRAANVAPGTVKEMRAAVLRDCLETACAADPSQRLFSLTVPTGGGKTLASMAFALQRAVALQAGDSKPRADSIRRIVVVIPYLSIIEQNADVFTDVFGPGAILEHHSGKLVSSLGRSDDDGEDMSRAAQRRKLAEESWDAPLIVTTSVRFFETLFSNTTSALRRFHNLARAIVILDETQTLPKHLVGPTLTMLKQFADNLNTQFVFCTATQPAFEKPDYAAEDDLRWTMGQVAEIVREPKRLFERLQRVNITWPAAGEKTSWDELAERIVKDRRALCVVNLKKHARELYDKVKQRALEAGIALECVFHLSTWMCAAHRLDVLKRIRESDKASPCLVISTQLIEAGVDLDFPVVYRAMAPLDSIAQAAGRCDREGLLTAQLGRPGGRVVVFRPDAKSQHPPGYGEGVDITEILLKLYDGQLSIYELQHIEAYFNQLYEGNLDSGNVDASRCKLDYPSVAEKFRLIEDITQAVLVPYGTEGKELIPEFTRAPFITKALRRRAQRYQVGLFYNPQNPACEFNLARKVGAIYALTEDEDVWACRDGRYESDLGISFSEYSPAELVTETRY